MCHERMIEIQVPFWAFLSHDRSIYFGFLLPLFSDGKANLRRKRSHTIEYPVPNEVVSHSIDPSVLHLT